MQEIRTEELFKRHEERWDHEVPFLSQEDQPGLAIRTYRALTWVHYARGETQDDFTPFVFYWIAFNALYATRSDGKDTKEWEAQRSYASRLLVNEEARKLVRAALDEADGRIGDLLRETPGFARNPRAVEAARSGTTEQRLAEVVERLAKIRNWMFHGGVARRSHVLGACVTAGTGVMTRLVPAVVHAMLKCSWPRDHWGGVPWSPDVYATETVHEERPDLRIEPAAWRTVDDSPKA